MSASTEHLHCTAMWHLRDKPFAAVVLNYALSLCKPEEDGKRHFHLSVRQLACYFGWHKDTALSAIEALRGVGFFELIRHGKGPLASEYEVLTHREWASAHPKRCKVTVPLSRTVNAPLVSGSGGGTVRSEGGLLCGPDRTQSPIVSDHSPLVVQMERENDPSVLRAVDETWEYFIRELGHIPRLYTFTPSLRKMAADRLQDALLKTDGNLDNAKTLMKLCIDYVRDSDYHHGKNDKKAEYLDFGTMFRSTEQFDKYLRMCEG